MRARRKSAPRTRESKNLSKGIIIIFDQKRKLFIKNSKGYNSVLSAQSGSYLSKAEIMRICNVYGKGKGCGEKLGDKENLGDVDV